MSIDTSTYDIHLIDGTSLSYRAFYVAQTACRNSYQLLAKMVIGLRAEEAAPRTIFVLDPSGTTWRHQVSSSYKPGGLSRPPGVERLVEFSCELADLVGWRFVRVPGYEADDVIATLSTRWQSVLITSPDKDMFQLMSNGDASRRVDVRDPKTKVLVTPAQVEEKFGVGPARVRDFLALVGDPADGFSGVAGCGQKIAIDLLRGFPGGVEQIMGLTGDGLSEVVESLSSTRSRSVARRLCAPGSPDMESLRECWVLAGLRRDVKIPLSHQDVATRVDVPMDRTNLRTLLRRVGIDARSVSGLID